MQLNFFVNIQESTSEIQLIWLIFARMYHPVVHVSYSLSTVVTLSICPSSNFPPAAIGGGKQMYNLRVFLMI